VVTWRIKYWVFLNIIRSRVEVVLLKQATGLLKLEFDIVSEKIVNHLKKFPEVYGKMI
jgi:hypothetical protein